MLRRRHSFFIGIISIAAGITIALAQSVNLRKSYVSRGAKIDCTGHLGENDRSPLCRRFGAILERRNEIHEKPEKPTTGNAGSEDAERTVIDRTTLQTEIPTSETAVDEARGKKGKKRGLLKVFFMMAAAAKATMLYAMIHAVALVAGKALVTAKIALALAAAVALKKALEHNDKTSVEIVKHPHHTYSQSHSSSVDYDHHDGGHRRRRRRA